MLRYDSSGEQITEIGSDALLETAKASVDIGLAVAEWLNSRKPVRVLANRMPETKTVDQDVAMAQGMLKHGVTPKDTAQVLKQRSNQYKNVKEKYGTGKEYLDRVVKGGHRKNAVEKNPTLQVQPATTKKRTR